MSNAYKTLKNMQKWKVDPIIWETDDINILKILATNFDLSTMKKDAQLEVLIEHNDNKKQVGQVLDLIVPNITYEYNLIRVLDHEYCSSKIAELVWDNLITNFDLYSDDSNQRWAEVLVELSKSPHIKGDIPFDIFKWVRDLKRAPRALYHRLQIQRNLYKYHRAQLPNFAVAIIETTVPGI